MSSPRSPHREVGLDANEIACRQPKRRRLDLKKGDWSGDNTPGLVKYGHVWDFDSSASAERRPFGKRRRTAGANNAPCIYCRQPRFVVDGTPCMARHPATARTYAVAVGVLRRMTPKERRELAAALRLPVDKIFSEREIKRVWRRR